MNVTTKADLRHSKPFWAATPNIVVRTEKRPSRREYDCVIVGGGVSGALVARLAANGKRHILVFDRRRPVHGSTMASTAMILHEIDTPLTKLAKMIGRNKAARAWKRSAKAVNDLERTLASHGVECGFERKKALYLAGDELGYRALRAEAEMREQIGLSAQYLEGARLESEFGVSRTGAVISDCSASANPAQMTAGLFQSLPSSHVTICEQVEIKDYRETGDEVVVATSEGSLLSAGHVIFCTGYEFLKPMQSRHHETIATWAFATAPHAPRPDWLNRHIVWEASDPYLYFRTTSDGRIIAGGEDEKNPEAIDDDAKMARKIATIHRKLESVLGMTAPKPDYYWAARFGNSADGLPIIDCAPGCKRVLAVMGFGGNGITYSMIAAQIAAEWINGRSDPDAALFKFR